MVLIKYLKSSPINNDVLFAEYKEGPDNFDEWFSLVKEKYPNIKGIYCSNNKLVTLNCPGIDTIYCQYNNLIDIYCPDCKKLYCHDNELIEIYGPNINTLICNQNPDLRYIEAPELKRLKYDKRCDIEIPLDLKNPIIEGQDGKYLKYSDVIENMIIYHNNTKSARKT